MPKMNADDIAPDLAKAGGDACGRSAVASTSTPMPVAIWAASAFAALTVSAAVPP